MKKPQCPKCGCKRWRHVGEIAFYPGPKPSMRNRKVVSVVIECMNCDEVYEK